MIKRLGFLLALFALVVFMSGAAGCSIWRGNLEVVLDDLYYEEYYVRSDETFDILVAKVTIQNSGSEDIKISRAYLLDGNRESYNGLLLYRDWTKNACQCSLVTPSYDKIETVMPDDSTGGYFMAFKEVPKDISGLRLIIETDDEVVNLSLGNTETLRMVSLPDYAK